MAPRTLLAESFLDCPPASGASCLVLEVISGLGGSISRRYAENARKADLFINALGYSSRCGL